MTTFGTICILRGGGIDKTIHRENSKFYIQFKNKIKSPYKILLKKLVP
jgi:hypothetical protein